MTTEMEFAPGEGPESDRQFDVNNNPWSPHNVGWYSDLNDEQRYTLIVFSYLSVAHSVAGNDGRTMDDVTDWEMWIAANAPSDTEAIAAGAEYAEGSEKYSKLLHDGIFGTGDTELPELAMLDIPKIPVGGDDAALERYDMGMMRKISDDPDMLMKADSAWYTDWGMAGNYFKGRMMEGDAADIGKGMEAMRINLSGVSPEKKDYPSFGPTDTDFYKRSAKARHGEDYNVQWQQAQNAAADIPGLALDILLGGVALGGAKAIAGSVGREAVKASGSSVRNMLARGLNALKRKPGKMSVRRKLAYGSAGVAVGSTAADYAGSILSPTAEAADVPGLAPETAEMLREFAAFRQTQTGTSPALDSIYRGLGPQGFDVMEQLGFDPVDRGRFS